MNKQSFLKWFMRGTLILAILPILLFLGFAGAVSLIDFNQYKPQIEAEIAKTTGREFKINGSVEVSVLPFMFNVGQMSLKNREGFTEEALLSIEEVQVELSLVSLFLKKELSVISLEVIEPVLHLIQTEQGDNWSDIALLAQWLPDEIVKQIEARQFALLDHEFDYVLDADEGNEVSAVLSHARKMPTATEWFDSLQRVQVSQVDEPSGEKLGEKEDERAGTTQVAKPKFDWAFDSLVIRDGTWRLENQVSGGLVTFSKIDLLTFDVVKDQPFDISSQFSYEHSASARRYDVHLNSQLEINERFQQWRLSNWDGLLTFHLPAEEKVPAIRLTSSGERFEVDLETRTVQVSEATLAGLGARLTTSFSGLMGVPPALKGSVTLQDVNFKEWAYHLGLPLPEFTHQTALTEGNGQFEWQWDGQKLLLQGIQLQVDESTLQGELSYQRDATPSLLFDLTVDRLDFDAYQAQYIRVGTIEAPLEAARPGDLTPLQAAVETEEGIAKSSKQPESPESFEQQEQRVQTYLPIGLPIERLRQLSAKGELAIGQLTAWNLTASSLQVSLIAEQGVLSFAPLDAEFYQGTLRSKLILDVAHETPRYRWTGRLDEVNLQETLASQAENFIVDGVLSSRFDLHTKGVSDATLKQNLNGLWSSELTQVKIAGLDINQVLSGQIELTGGHTLLERVYLAGQWQQGVYSAKQFQAQSERFSGSGSGHYDLNRAQIDSQFLLAIDQPAEGLALLKGVSVPLEYQGILFGGDESRTTTDEVLKKATWKVDVEQVLASPAYHAQQKQLVADLSRLLQ